MAFSSQPTPNAQQQQQLWRYRIFRREAPVYLEGILPSSVVWSVCFSTGLCLKCIYPQGRGFRFGPSGRRIRERNGGLGRHSHAAKETARVGVRASLVERAEGKSRKSPPGDHTRRKRGARRRVRWGTASPPPQTGLYLVTVHPRGLREGGERRAGPQRAVRRPRA